MVKNKRDLKSPRRSRSFTGTRPTLRGKLAGSSASKGHIRVIVRVRPLNNRESGDNSRNVIKVLNEQSIIFDPKEDGDPFFFHGMQQHHRDIMKKANKNLQFTFDRVFAGEINNDDLFQESTKGLIQSLMDGYNCSVFVYGATGAGKTHTMLGHELDPGITILTMKELFKFKNDLSDERDFELGITYLEVYNENVQDLLNPGPPLHLREDGKFGVVVTGIQVHRIDEAEKLFSLLEQGSRNRTQHPTDANAESSRSHAVFQVYVHMKFKTTGEVRAAKLSMIDLAGSERGAATGYSGARFAEGANINKSLLALGNCINSLADGQKHIPYRDSKLTRLLKDSLGGNCQTIMIANVSPSSLSYEETYNTLKYAMRAKKIKSNIKKNVVNCDTNIQYLNKMVEDLTNENRVLKLQVSLSQKLCNCNTTTDEQDGQHQKELQSLYADRFNLEGRIQQLESTEQLMTTRKQLKEESDARLSGICTDTPDRERGHKRLGNAVSCLERQVENVQRDISLLNSQSKELESKTKELLEKAPHLKSFAETEDAKLANFKANNKIEHLQKIHDLLHGELKMRNNLIERFSEVVKPCFWQLRGHGFVTDDLASKYNGLIRHLQGIRTVTWEDKNVAAIADVDVNENEERTTPDLVNHTFVLNNPDSQSQAGKDENEKEEEAALNTTFGKSSSSLLDKIVNSNHGPSPKPTSTQAISRPLAKTQGIKRPIVSAKHLMAKVTKSSTNWTSPKKQYKENKPPFRLVSNKAKSTVLEQGNAKKCIRPQPTSGSKFGVNNIRK